MTQEGTLTALREGERARVAALLTEGGMRRRMPVSYTHLDQ